MHAVIRAVHVFAAITTSAGHNHTSAHHDFVETAKNASTRLVTQQTWRHLTRNSRQLVLQALFLQGFVEPLHPESPRRQAYLPVQYQHRATPHTIASSNSRNTSKRYHRRELKTHRTQPTADTKSPPSDPIATRTSL